MKIDLLMEFNSELGLEYLRTLLVAGIKINSLLVIGDKPDTHRERLVEERTRGLYKN